MPDGLEIVNRFSATSLRQKLFCKASEAHVNKCFGHDLPELAGKPKVLYHYCSAIRDHDSGSDGYAPGAVLG